MLEILKDLIKNSIDLEQGVGPLMIVNYILPCKSKNEFKIKNSIYLERGVGAAHVSLRRWSASLYLDIYLNDCDNCDNANCDLKIRMVLSLRHPCPSIPISAEVKGHYFSSKCPSFGVLFFLTWGEMICKR